MKTTTKLLFSMMLVMMSTLLSAQQLAFPGAQGWGRFAKGARASGSPTVYHVTNLNDSGTGSFRDAVTSPNRVIVFDVAGTIRIKSALVFAKNLTVLGQTAPRPFLLRPLKPSPGTSPSAGIIKALRLTTSPSRTPSSVRVCKATPAADSSRRRAA